MPAVLIPMEQNTESATELPRMDRAAGERTTHQVLESLRSAWPGPSRLLDASGDCISVNGAGDLQRASLPIDPQQAGQLVEVAGVRWRISGEIEGRRLAIPDPPSSADEARRFTAAISHEIRTPLNGLLGMAALLEETSLEPAQSEYVAAIRKSGARLLDLLNNVLDYTRLDAGQIPLERTPFDPEELVQDVAELVAPRAHAAGLDIAAVVDPRLPQLMVGDSGRIRQILFNLAGNAVKFTESGCVLIEAACGEGGSGISLIVRDTGLGIPFEARARLFEAFGQARVADARRDGGVGLGLAIVAKLVDAMNGRISVQSEPGSGSMFRVDLPLVQAESHGAGVLEGPGKRLGAPGPKRISLDLRRASYLACLRALADGSCLLGEALAEADLAILDAALLPGQIAAIARRTPSIVVMRPEDRSRIPHFRDLGCVGYLIRPLRRASIVERVRLALAGVREADPTGETPPADRGRVLIADDNPVNALLASRALTVAGFRVDVAATGAEALERATETAYVLVFMDIRMPVMDGLEATRLIRRLPSPAGIVPIVALTADLDPMLSERARSSGITALATKPIDPAQLRSLAERWARPVERGPAAADAAVGNAA